MFAQTLLDETFNYTVGDTIGAHGWTEHSGGASNAIKVTNGSLTYNGFVNSGLGNSVALTTSGQDCNRRLITSDSITSGSVYASFLVKVTAAQTGDYFFHFASNNIGQGIFRGRVYAKLASNGGVAFGIAKGVLPVKWNDSLTTPYTLNTTYLIVVKYTFSSTSTADDTVKLWVNPTMNGVEPAPLVTATDATVDPASISLIALRQGSTAAMPSVILTGIHVAKTWDLGASSASLSLTSPAGGESWTVGTSHNITWTSSGVTNVKLESSADGGTTWSDIIASTAASANSYAWTVPSTAGTNYKVRISDVDGKATAVTSAAFTLAAAPVLAITSPVGGESWTVATSQNITWTNTNVANVKLEYSTDSGTNWTTIIASTAASAGTYAWTVPNTPATTCVVRVSDVSGTATAVTSTAVFTIKAAVVPTLVITAPVGSESWTVATSHNITWTSSNVTTVKLEYSSDSASTWNTIVANTPASAGTYAWTVPNAVSAKCFVKVSDSTAAASASKSGVFAIVAAPTYTTIAAARAMTAGTTTGGAKVTVSGIVNSPNFNASKNSFYIQDATAGINVFGGTLATYALGDSLVVTGWLMGYRGTLELTDTISTAVSLVITKVSSGNTVPSPKVISIAELNTNGENYESQLITIKNVTKISGTWPATAATATLKCKVATATGTTDTLTLVVKNPSELIGSVEPTWPQDVIGIGTQYTTTGTGGYQIQPRYKTDFGTVTAVQPEQQFASTIKGFALAQNYPNPFNPTTSINYSLDKAGLVSLKVYNILGTEVASLVGEYKSAGNYNVSFNAASLTSGIYLYKLQVGNQSLTKKLTLMK